MLANWKSIAVFIDDTPDGERIGDYAAGLARHFNAHLIGIHVISGYPGEHAADSFARGKAAISAEFRVIWSWGDDAEAVINSLHSDVVILGHPFDGGPAGKRYDCHRCL